MKKFFPYIFSALFLVFSIDSYAAGCEDSGRTCTALGTTQCESDAYCEVSTTDSNCIDSTSSGTFAVGTTCATLTLERDCKNTIRCQWVVDADTNNNAFVEVTCNALKIVTGNAGKAVAAFAIISVGLGFFTGKVSWGLMIGVAAGVGAMFGAPTIVAAISGEDAVDCGA